MKNTYTDPDLYADDQDSAEIVYFHDENQVEFRIIHQEEPK